MATKATFLADFTSFISAVDKAEVRLRTFESGAGGVEKALTRIGNSFSGVRVVQEATLAATAIERLGEEGGIAAGLTKLTSDELQRAGTMAKEAAAKLTALGQEVPPNIQAVVNAVEPLPKHLTLADKAAGLAKSTFGQMFGAFTAANLITNAVTGLVNFGKSAFEGASKTADLSEKLGIGTEAIQRMDHVANQTGSTVDQFASAAFKLGTRLSGGSDSVKAGVDALGFSLEKLMAMKPEDRFEAVVTALGKMDDATRRNELGVQLFGKSFESIAAGVAAGYDKVADGANVSSDAQIQALDRAGDAWQNFKDRQAANLTSILGNTVQTVEAIREVISERGIFSSTFGVISEAQRRVQVGAVGARQTDIALSTTNALAAATENYVTSLKKAEAAVSGLTKEQREQLDAALKLGESEEVLSDRFGLSEAALRIYSGRVKEHKAAVKDAGQAAREAAAEFKKEQDELTRARESLFGTDTINKADLLVKALGDISNVTVLTKDKQRELNAAVLAAIETYKRMGAEAPRNLRQVEEATRELTSRTGDYFNLMKAIPANIETVRGDASRATREMTIDLTNHFEEIILMQGTAEKASSDWRKELGTLADAFGNLGAIGGDALSGIARGIGTMTTAIDTATKAWDSLTDGFKTITSGSGLKSILGGFTSIVSGIGGIVSAAMAGIQVFGALKDKLAGGEEGMIVNPARDKFTEQFRLQFGGGNSFEGLVNALSAAGIQGDRAEYYIRLLQQADSVEEWEQAQRAFLEALEGGGLTGFHTFHKGGAVPGTGDVPAMLQGGEGVLSTRGMAALDQLNRGQGLSPVPITVVLELDGRVLGRATAEYLPGALATMGVRVA